MNLTKNFSMIEMSCKCGNCSSVMNRTFMTKLQTLRSFYNRPMEITSGARCLRHNEAVGGVLSSYHLDKGEGGRAADIKITSSIDRGELLVLALRIFGGIGMSKNFIHVDDRTIEGFPIVWTY